MTILCDIKFLVLVNIYYINSIFITGKDIVHIWCKNSHHNYIVIFFNILAIFAIKYWQIFNNYNHFLLKNKNYFLFFFRFLKYIFKFTFNKYIYLESYHKINSFNKIYLVLDFLSLINKSTKKIEPLIFFTLAYSTYKDIFVNFSIVYSGYISLKNQDTLEISISSFIFLIGVLIKLIKITEIWISNDQFKQDFPVLHNIIKYILFSLLSINFIILIIIGQKLLIMIITYLKKFFLNMNIMNKLRDLKLSLDYKRVKGNNPKNPEVQFFSDLKNKRKNKKKASYLKEKILNIQQKRNLNKNSTDTTFKQTSFSERRGWKETINLGDKPKFTVKEQLNNVKSEFKAYDNQERKFKKIVIDINKKKENFFADESRFLFKEYISVIKLLKKNLKSVEKRLLKEK